MWSLGCIVVELFLGLPLFPGSSEYNQVSRITEMLGLPPHWMLEMGKQSGEFFEKSQDEYGRKQYRLKSMEQYSREHGTKEQPSKKYFSATTLPDIIKNYPMPRKNMKPNEIERGEQHQFHIQVLQLTRGRNGQPGCLYRFRSGIAKPQSPRTLDPRSGEASSVYHTGQVYWAVRTSNDAQIQLKPIASTGCSGTTAI